MPGNRPRDAKAGGSAPDRASRTGHVSLFDALTLYTAPAGRSVPGRGTRFPYGTSLQDVSPATRSDDSLARGSFCERQNMSTVIITLVVLAVVAVALALAWPTMRNSGTSLQRRFGPEYDRVVEQQGGDTKAARNELNERLRRYGNLRTQRLTAENRERYTAEWATLQEQFVDSPAHAVAEAERLLSRLARDRGYPADEFDEQIAALSVHHAHHIGAYRHLHTVAHHTREGREHDGRMSTEELREVLVDARAFFERLMDASHDGGGRNKSIHRRDAHGADLHGEGGHAKRGPVNAAKGVHARDAHEHDIHARPGRGSDRDTAGTKRSGRFHLPWSPAGQGQTGTTRGGA